MKKLLLIVLVALIMLFAGCTSSPEKSASEKHVQPVDESRERTTGALSTQGTFSTDTAGLMEARQTETVELKDGDRYDLTASIVKKIGDSEVKMLAYNGSIPGPLIKVPQGAEITVNFTNNTDVPTTIHSHGIRLANEFDGIPDVTQPEVGIGETFIYNLTFPDAGMYWYHPHLREDYAQELGLYGNYLVTPSDASYWSPVNREVPLFLDDILLEDGKIAPFNQELADHTLMGRFGNAMLVNGETDYALSVQKGEVIRFYLTNAANVRPFNFAIDGAKMKLVGADGGAYENEEWKDAVLLSPSERAIIEVLFDTTGTHAIQNKTPERTYTLGSVVVSSQSVSISYAGDFQSLNTNSATVKSIDPFRASFDKASDKRITLSISMNGMNMQGMSQGGHMMPDGSMMGGSAMQPSDDGIEWEDTSSMMNAMSNTDTVTWKIIDQDTGKENEDIDWNFKVGDKVKISIFNDSKSMHPMQHPIHLHGQRFLALNTNGKKSENLVWKDTALIQAGDTVEFLVDMSNPGEWMLHCHIPEHMESGMMFNFTVT